MSAPNARTATRLGTAAALCFAYFLLALLALHALRPDYTMVDHMISDYAVGRFGWVMTTAFASAALGCLMLGIGMFLAGPRSWLARIGAVLLIVASVGLLVTALFPTDLETAPSTRTGDIHAQSFFVNIVALFLATVSLGLSYGASDYWRRRRPAALGFAALMVAAFAAQILTLHRGAPYGIANRAFVVLLMAWLISTSLWVRRAAIMRA